MPLGYPRCSGTAYHDMNKLILNRVNLVSDRYGLARN